MGKALEAKFMRFQIIALEGQALIIVNYPHDGTAAFE